MAQIRGVTLINVTPLIWAIESQNNESFIKVAPLIWANEGENNESFIIKLRPLRPLWKIP